MAEQQHVPEDVPGERPVEGECDRADNTCGSERQNSNAVKADIKILNTIAGELKLIADEHPENANGCQISVTLNGKVIHRDQCANDGSLVIGLQINNYFKGFKQGEMVILAEILAARSKSF